MKGTEKQIAWAEDIRKEKIAQAQSALDYTRQAKGVTSEQISQFEAALANLQSYDSASWWIEHKAMMGTELLKLTYKEYLGSTK